MPADPKKRGESVVCYEEIVKKRKRGKKSSVLTRGVKVLGHVRPISGLPSLPIPIESISSISI